MLIVAFNSVLLAFTVIPVIKYGISDELRNGLSRPENQLLGIQMKWGLTVKLRILARTINRQQALYYESQLVNQHVNFWKTMPRAQFRPFPN